MAPKFHELLTKTNLCKTFRTNGFSDILVLAWKKKDRKEKGGLKKIFWRNSYKDISFPVFCQNKFFQPFPMYFIPENILLINIPLESCEKSQSLILMR